MDFVFNELCLQNAFPNIERGRSGIENLLQVCKQGRDLGMSRLAIRPDFYVQSLLEGYCVIDWLNDQAVSKSLKHLLLSIVRQPYIDNNDTSIEERYILSNAFWVGEVMLAVEGLAIAYLYNTVSISFYSAETWNIDEISLKFTQEGYDEQIVRVKHASQVRHIEVHKDWIGSRIGQRLRTTDLHFSQKEIHLRDDHGKDVLLRFSRKLVRSPYIIKVINSMPYNCHDHDFIKNCYEDGRIEIVLVRSDEGFGVVVQTTGNNIDETEAISQILFEEFHDGY